MVFGGNDTLFFGGNVPFIGGACGIGSANLGNPPFDGVTPFDGAVGTPPPFDGAVGTTTPFDGAVGVAPPPELGVGVGLGVGGV